MAYRTLIIFIFSSFSSYIYGAACCGGGASLPNLITGDYKAQYSLGISNSTVTHHVNKDGEFSKKDKDDLETSETITLRGAIQFADLWQTGITVPIVQNTREQTEIEEKSSGLGDVSLQVAYEFMPEYSYSAWKPRGFVFLQHSLGNAKSTLESDKIYSTDSFGTGIPKTALGLSFVKIKGLADFTLMGEYHQTMSKRFKNENKTYNVQRNSGHSFLLGLGFSPKNGSLRYGTNFVYTQENSKEITGDISSPGALKETLELGLNLSYMLTGYSFTANYIDQSYLGKAKNINAKKTISFNLVKFLDL